MADMAYVYVDEQAISPSLYCPICLDILQEPHTHVFCDSAFCRSCLLQLAEPFCPICRWTWNDRLPLEYNNCLPKAGRLIRNMLDDLRVQCISCQTIRRRGDFEHECEPIIPTNRPRKSLPALESAHMERSIHWTFLFTCLLWASLVYYQGENLFQPAITNRTRTPHPIATNLDTYVLGILWNFVTNLFWNLFTNLFSDSMNALLINMIIWLGVKCFGERYLSKATSRLLENVFETSIILNIIIRSFSR